MNYFSNYYIKNDFDNVYLENVKKFIKFDTNIFGDKLDYMLLSFKQNLNYYDEINTYARNTYVNYDLNNFNEEVNQLVSSESFKTCISALDEVLSAYNTITPEMGNEIVNKVKEKTNLKGKELFMPIRIIAIGKEHGPEMNKILYIVGKEKIKQNISNFLNK
jgi:glutamyl/glutaminyl-tRNA synthetase